MRSHKGIGVPKAGIGELFGRERALRLPPLVRGLSSIQISERALRNLITILIVVFLVMLGVALVLQLSASRQRHVTENSRLSTLYLKMAASELSGVLSAAMTEGQTTRPISTEDLAQVLPAEAIQAGRGFAVLDGDGKVEESEVRRGRH